uniref:Putative secreted protein n=1 Tax=Ixodes ricinus TaxID=34613 RepID=A0A6B0UEC7_IXORI
MPFSILRLRRSSLMRRIAGSSRFFFLSGSAFSRADMCMHLRPGKIGGASREHCWATLKIAPTLFVRTFHCMCVCGRTCLSPENCVINPSTFIASCQLS